jgi:hypothetical protein
MLPIGANLRRKLEKLRKAMIFMDFYRNMIVPTKSEDIAIKEFLKVK